MTNVVFAHNLSGKHFNPMSCGVIRNQHKKLRRFNIISTGGGYGVREGALRRKYMLFKKIYTFSKNIYTFLKNICYSYVLLENICLTYVIVPLCAARAQGAAHKGPAITSNIGQIYALI